MALTRGQLAKMPHTVSIYKSHIGTGNRRQYSTTPDYTGVRCRYGGTSNFDLPNPQGRTFETNIMTSDKWMFPAGQDIDDNYLIKLTTPGHPYTGTFWTVEGVPQTRFGVSGRNQAKSKMIYARITPPPAGVS